MESFHMNVSKRKLSDKYKAKYKTVYYLTLPSSSKNEQICIYKESQFEVFFLCWFV